MPFYWVKTMHGVWNEHRVCPVDGISVDLYPCRKYYCILRSHRVYRDCSSAHRADAFTDCKTQSARSGNNSNRCLSLIHISEPTRLGMISYAVFCLKKK